MSRTGAVLALGQVRHQLLVLVRSPMGFFVTLVVPVLLLLCLNLLTPDTVAAIPGGGHYAQFLTPAIGTFCLLNAAYVNTVNGVVLAREEGILKRLRGTPLPAWTYLAGRFGAALVTATVGLGLITGIGVAFFHVHMVWGAFGYLLAVVGLGFVVSFRLGFSVTTLVPKPETALPVAYGMMLPLGVISDVFFSSAHAPQWLHDLASALPVAPVARAMEAAFQPTTHAWPMPRGELIAIAAWAAGALLLTAFTFRWEPGPLHWSRRRRSGAVL